MATDGFDPYLDAIEELLGPIVQAADDPWRAEALLRDLGYAPPGDVVAFQELRSALDALDEVVQAARDAGAAGDRAGLLESMARLLPAIAPLLDAVNRFHDTVSRNFAGSPLLTETDILAAIARKLGDYLVVRYLEGYHPGTAAVLQAMGVIEVEDVEEAPTAFHLPYRRRRVLWEELPKAVGDPLGRTLATLDGGDEILYERLLYLLHLLALSFGLLPAYAAPEPTALAALNNDADLGALEDAEELSVLWFPFIRNAFLSVGVDVYPLAIPETGRYSGIGLALRTGAAADVPLSDAYRLEIRAGAEVRDGLGVRLPRAGRPRLVGRLFTAPSEIPETVPFHLTFAIRPTEVGPAGRLLALEGPSGSRLEIESGSLTFGVRREGTLDLFADAELRGGSASLRFDDADGFLQSLVAPEGITAAFGLGVRISSRDGVSFADGSGLDVRIPLAQHDRALALTALGVALRPASDRVTFHLTVDFAVRLGPLRAAVQDVGVRAPIRIVPDRTGNLGPLDAAFDFDPPTGVGLALDAGAVTGGGFLSFDRARSEYAGALDLDLDGVALKAFGLLTTRLPGGAAGYSLLALITAEGFRPLQLGLGFTLNGVGGLVGINRSVAIEAMRGALTSGAFDELLFPRDPVANAGQLVSTARTLFPPAVDRHVVGPVGLVGWGTPTLVTCKVGVLLELPAPVRLVLVGTVRAVLPDERSALVRLQMNALGVVDLGRREASLDAVLHDSRILEFPLTGEMALRAAWGDRPSFALSVGGFHRRFERPAGFPALRRVSIMLASGQNPRLRLESYFAVTSNTIQFGGALEFFVAVGKLSLEGMFAFDALVQLDPFGFVAEIGSTLTLKWDGKVLFGVAVALTLSGPSPWRARGSATFRLLGFKQTLSFDHTFGDPWALPPPARVDAWAQLERALRAPGNWRGRAGAAPEGVSIAPRPAAASEPLVAPQADLEVSQRAVPLDRTIERVGAATPSGARRFSITRLRIAEKLVELEPAYDLFAPAQYLGLSDDEKIAAPAFDRMPSGARGASDVQAPVTAKPVRVEHETVIVDAAGTARPGRTRPVPPEAAASLADTGASAEAGVAGRGRFRAAALGIDARDARFVVASRADLRLQERGDGSYSAAREVLGLREAELQIVGQVEARA